MIKGIKSGARKYNEMWSSLPRSVRIVAFPTLMTGTAFAIRVVETNQQFAIVFGLLLLVTLLQHTHTFLEEEDTSNLKRRSLQRKALLNRLNQYVALKSMRLLEALNEGEGHTSIIVRKARGKLDISKLERSIIKHLHDVLHDLSHGLAHSEAPNIRVNLMKPNVRQPVFFQVAASYETESLGGTRFEVQQLRVDDRSTVSGYLWNEDLEKMRSVPDTMAAADKGKFKFLHDAQRGHVKSMICYRADDPDTGEKLGILYADSNVKNMFPSKEKNSIDYDFYLLLFRSFEQVLLYERRLHRIIEQLDKLITTNPTERGAK